LDARFPERWINDRRIMRLTTSAFRSFVCSLTWSVSNRTDGMIDADDVPLIPGLVPVDIAELITGGLLATVDGGWLIVDFASTQTSADAISQLEQMRRAARERKAAQRVRERAAAEELSRDMSRGQHRLGQASKREEEPPLFCDHHPRGAGGAPCNGCRDARLLHDAWKASRHTSSGVVTEQRDPAHCSHINGAGRSTVAVNGCCSLCGAVIELAEITS